MTETLALAPPTAANSRAIKARHMKNVQAYGEGHKGVVPTVFLKKEALDAMYEVFPERRAYPLRDRRCMERIYTRISRRKSPIISPRFA